MFPHLFAPGRIGSLTLKNRIVLSAMGSHQAEADGTVTEGAIRYYARRARGGAALVTVEATTVHPTGRIAHATDLSEDRFIPNLARLANAVHDAGARASIQLYHPGRQANARVLGCQPVAPSAVKSPVPAHDPPRALSTEEVREFVVAFAEAARRAKEAGFDAVEFHGAHGYLICQFLSPWANHRTDRYGGSLENRCRFACEILEETRRRVGSDLPVIFRISADERVEGGLTVEETSRIAWLLQEAGADAILVSAGTFVSVHEMVQPMWKPDAALAALAGEVRRHVRIPVILVGKVLQPELAEALLAEGVADFIAMGRALLCDPDLPNKAREGRTDAIRPCIACNTCLDLLLDAKPVRCLLNPAEDVEETVAPVPPEARRRVAVVGAGPAGMEAALVLARRGHDVTLYDRSPSLGGQVAVSAAPDWKKGYEGVTRYFQVQLRAAGVRLALGRAVTAEDLLADAPDAVVVATGSRPIRPDDLPGTDLPHVVVAEDVLLDRVPVGRQVAVIGGGDTGCEVALHLARRGHRVTILRRGPKIGQEMGKSYKWFILGELIRHGVRLMPGVRYRRIAPEGVVLEGEGGREEVVPADTVVLAVGYRPEDSLYRELKRRGTLPVYLVGDAVHPRNILVAIEEGLRVAAAI